MSILHVDGDNCPCCINAVAVMHKYLPEWSADSYIQFLEAAEERPMPSTQPIRGLIEDMIVMSNMMSGTPGREWKVFSEDEPTPYDPVAAGRRAANYVQGLKPRIASINGITLEDGGDTSFPNN